MAAYPLCTTVRCRVACASEILELGDHDTYRLALYRQPKQLYSLDPDMGTSYSFPMRIIAKRTLRQFWETHPDAEPSLQTWYKTVELAEWEMPADVKSYYASASILANNRVCFNIAGNKYRLIVKIEYQLRLVYIRFVGTHAEYDAIDVATV